jgi:hypothetical protein
MSHLNMKELKSKLIDLFLSVKVRKSADVCDIYLYYYMILIYID